MRRALILVVLLLAIGVGVIGPSYAQNGDRRNPCVRRCRGEFREASRHCRNLPPAERRECERRARERHEDCVRNCR